MSSANIINHIVLVLDASTSMQGKSARELIKVADNQIEHLALRSQELDQETRITVYSFEGSGFTGHRFATQNIQCLIWDKDVLRMPSISALYRTGGSTPLIDAAVVALDDLALVTEKYGEHSFLIYVLTDGEENASKATASQLSAKIAGLPSNWTVAAFVPNQTGVERARRYGFPASNISVWSATAEGLAEVGSIIRTTTENFMQGRKVGIRGTKDLFSLKEVSRKEVTEKLDVLHRSAFDVFSVDAREEIKAFVERKTGKPYKIGTAYYQLSKREHIQPQKQIAIVTNEGVHVGDAARQLLGLPDENVKVDPPTDPNTTIFVQSTSGNRKLMPYTQLLVIP